MFSCVTCGRQTTQRSWRDSTLSALDKIVEREDCGDCGGVGGGKKEGQGENGGVEKGGEVEEAVSVSPVRGKK